MKTKTTHKIVKPKIKHTTTLQIEQPTTPNTKLLGLLVIAAVVVSAIAIALVAYVNIHNITNTTIQFEPPKDINWFYNKSAELTFLKSRIDDIDNQTSIFTKKHGTDRTGYDPNEQERIHELESARTMLAVSYNEKAADYNSHAEYMNKSWNRSLPRQIYDIP
jgi:hypothetical protein